MCESYVKNVIFEKKVFLSFPIFQLVSNKEITRNMPPKKAKAVQADDEDGRVARAIHRQCACVAGAPWQPRRYNVRHAALGAAAGAGGQAARARRHHGRTRALPAEHSGHRRNAARL